MSDKPTTPAPAPAKLPEARAQGSAVAPRRPGVYDLFGLRSQIDRLFDDFGLSWPRLGFLEPIFDRSTREWIGDNWGASDISETDSAYRISIELPGCEDKNLDVSVANGTVSIRGEKKQESKETAEQYLSTGRKYGSFQQTFRIPEDADVEKITATYKNGVLELVMPKNESAKKSVKKIAISKE